MAKATQKDGCPARGWFAYLHVHNHADNTNFSVLHLLQAFLCLPHIVEIPTVMGHKELTQGGATQADQRSKHNALWTAESALPKLP